MANHVEATITLSNDIGEIPITFRIEWPENQGLYALHALKKFDQVQNLFGNSIYNQLIENEDASLVERIGEYEGEQE